MSDIVERLRHPKATQAEMEAAAEIERLRSRPSINGLLAKIEHRDAEIERLREMLQVCRDKWIPFREVEFRKRVREALGDE